MKGVGTFFLKTAIFCGLLLIICLAALRLNPNYETEYIAAIKPKLSKLREASSPKVVIIGGSNASFGVDSGMMEMELGLPVVNMALHGGLPLKFLLEQARDRVKEGDILILSKEYTGFRDQYWNRMSGTEVPKIVTYDASMIGDIVSDATLASSTVTGIFNTLKYYVQEYPIARNEGIASVYDSRVLRGDNILDDYIDGRYDQPVTPHELPKLESQRRVIRGLSKFNKQMERCGVKFFLTPPVVLDGYYNRQELKAFLEDLSKQTGIPLLNRAKDYVYDPKWFFNSHYHPNVAGRLKRTKSLIEDLRGHIPQALTEESKHLYVAMPGESEMASLSDMNKMRGFKIQHTHTDSLQVSQQGPIDKNYFRMRKKAQDFTGHQFYMRLQCTPEVMESLRFRSIGKREPFDSIRNLGNGQYEFWKELGATRYSDGYSYIGLALEENEASEGAAFTLFEVSIIEPLDLAEWQVTSYDPQIKAENYTFRFRLLGIETSVSANEILSGVTFNNSLEIVPYRVYELSGSADGGDLHDLATGRKVATFKGFPRLEGQSGFKTHVY